MPATKQSRINRDYNLGEVQNFRIHLNAGTSGLKGPEDGQAYYDSTAGNKRIYFYDAEVAGWIKVPRLDRQETVAQTWTFNPPSSGPPFALGANSQNVNDNKVTHLNADYLDGWHGSQSASADTAAIRNGDGTLSVQDPLSDLHAANRRWVINTLNKRDKKASVLVATTTSLPANTRTGDTLTANANGALPTIDGVTLQVGDELLVKNEGGTAAHINNGLYVADAVGDGSNPWSMTRRSDADEDAEVTSGATVFVDQGTSNLNSEWTLITDDPITVNTTAQEWTKTAGNQLYKPGNGLVLDGETFHFSQSTDYTIGDVFYASSTSAIAPLAAVATGNALISGGAGTAPSWGKVGLTTHVSGVLPIANGGTNSSTSLNNSRVMISSSGAIVERGALTNNYLVLGDSSQAVKTLSIGTGHQLVSVNSGATGYEHKTVTGVANEITVALTTGGLEIGISDPLKLTKGGTGDDLSATGATGGLVYKVSASAMSITGALTGVLMGNGSSAPTAFTGTGDKVVKWSNTTPYLTDSIFFDDDSIGGVGTTSLDPGSMLTVHGNGTFRVVDDTNGLQMKLQRQYSGGTPTAEDVLFEIHGRGEDSLNNVTDFVTIRSRAKVVTDGSEKGTLEFALIKGDGTTTVPMEFQGNSMFYSNMDGVSDNQALVTKANGKVESVPYSDIVTGGGNFTQGSVPFADSSGNLTEDNANLFWNDTSDRLALGFNDPQNMLSLAESGNIAVNMAVPTGVSATAQTTGGSLGAVTRHFVVTALDGVGETIESAEVSATTDGTGTDDSIDVNWTAVTGASKYRVYVSDTGAGNEDEYFEVTTSSFTYTGAVGTAGSPPASTTAYVNKVTASGDSWFLGGNFGVGTTSPATGLQVVGDISQSTGQSIIRQILHTGRKQNFAGNNGLGQSAGVKNTWLTTFADFTTSYAHGKGGSAFLGGVFDGESIWLVPYNSSDLVKVDPSDGSMTSYAHGKGSNAFYGGVFDGESIWLVPSSSSDLVKVDPSDGSMTSYAHGKGGSAFLGGVFDGESIWLVPFSSSDLVKVDPSDGSMTSYAHGKGGAAFAGGVFDGESIWLVPYNSSDLVKVDPSDGSMTSYAHGKGITAFRGGVFDGESIWLVPYSSSDLVKVDPSDGSMTSYAHGKGSNAFYGGVFDGESIWLVPFNSSDLVRVRPQEFGRPSLFTEGTLNVGGTAKIASLTASQLVQTDASKNLVSSNDLPSGATIGGNGIVDYTRQVLAGDGLSGGGALSSDVTLSVDEAYAFTWTAAHVWSMATPEIALHETDQAADEKRWFIGSSASNLRIETRTDINGTGEVLLSASRTTTTIDELQFINNKARLNSSGNLTLDGLLQADGTGVSYVMGGLAVGRSTVLTGASGRLAVSGINPDIQLEEDDEGVDGKVWSILVSGGQFSIRTRTDSGTASDVAFALNRTGTTIDDMTVSPPLIGSSTINAVGGFLDNGASTAGQYLRGNGSKITLSSILIGDLPVIDVERGGTGLTSGNSGGILYFSGTTTMASTAALTANEVVIGGGVGGAPSTVASGNDKILLSNGSGVPFWGLDLPNSTTLDSKSIARRFTQTLGDGVATSFTINHNFGTQNVAVVSRNTVTDELEDAFLVTASTANSVTLETNEAPASGQYAVTVLG